MSINHRHTDSAPGQVGGLARRIELRRRQLGLTHEGLAARARMAPRYLLYLAETEGEFDPDAFQRVATALELSTADLLDERADAPPGRSPAAPHPGSMKLSPRACWDRLGTHGIGRIGLSTASGPAIIPVNYTVDDRTVVFRTAADSGTAATVDTEVAFEVDLVDERLSEGWSVLIVGRAEHVGEPAALRRLAEAPGAAPWAGGRRDLVIRVVPTRITGRLVYAA
ncbi:hypothetical protein GXW83_14730 [Streptacidiphilus sp. PB12-B1b]|uniref:helix-turn-helix domain-containing protein n=1 Tax=Streptacidiphilus sp. PB12-B1b TaxID=2705012 RepID=UPI0015F7DEF4|nr:pyridoxamine 5'-phosphate oxidase family protein [Streptacidiphilus sp. PB12-B1b]QMU76805.1 hypothetical protein GXW83_14730 [Streptacidiphilus sp. PB12-B1b]